MTQKQIMLEMMRRGWTPSTDFIDAHIYRYGGRIHDLRKDGYQIEMKRLTRGTFAYRIVQVDDNDNYLLLNPKRLEGVTRSMLQDAHREA